MGGCENSRAVGAHGRSGSVCAGRAMGGSVILGGSVWTVVASFGSSKDVKTPRSEMSMSFADPALGICLSLCVRARECLRARECACVRACVRA